MHAGNVFFSDVYSAEDKQTVSLLFSVAIVELFNSFSLKVSKHKMTIHIGSLKQNGKAAPDIQMRLIKAANGY